jgi:RNA polymerase sigma-70 factor (ECF subfamily)
MASPEATCALLGANADPYGLTPLLEGAIGGEKQALEALLEKLRPYLHVLVRSQLGHEFAVSLDRSALVQEGLIRICQNITHLREHTVPQLLGWASQVMRHLVIDALRAKNREPCKVTGSRILEALMKSPKAEEEERRDRRSLQVAEALGKLPERRRQVIEMYFLEQLSDAEICQRIGGSVGAIRVLRLRALNQLRRLLQASPDSDCRPAQHPAPPDGDDA